jgi:hypothetical protein
MIVIISVKMQIRFKIVQYDEGYKYTFYGDSTL